MAATKSSKQDLQAAVAARRELGGEYEDAVLDSFLERVDDSIDARIERRVAERLGRRSGSLRKENPADNGAANRSFALGIVSLGTGIPITAVASSQSGVGGLIVAWAGIAAVNAVHALQNRRAR